MSSPRGTNNLCPFDPISTDNGSESPSGALSMDKESIDRLVEASAAEVEAAKLGKLHKHRLQILKIHLLQMITHKLQRVIQRVAMEREMFGSTQEL